MRNLYGILAAVMLVCMLCIPILSIAGNNPPAVSDESEAPLSTLPPAGKDDYFAVLNHETGAVESIPALEYVWGVVAAEMPASYEGEALKAQAVAAYTIAVKNRQEQENDPDPDLKGADLTTDSGIHQGYISRQSAKEKWGSQYDVYAKKIEAAVKAVAGETVNYNGEPITAAYCAVSSGKTESARVVWGGDLPCLTSVDSVCDLLAPDYLSEKAVDEKTFRETMKKLGFSSLPDTLSGCIVTPSRSEAGTVTEYKIGDDSATGQELREAFGLRSANFDIAEADGKVKFTVRGFGHGVGMSQFGADYMAKQGSGYREILQWYYPGSSVGKQ